MPEKAEQVSTEPAQPRWVELGGAGRSHSRFQRGNTRVGIRMCLYLSVSVDLEGTQPYPCLRRREIKEIGGEGLALASVAPFQF